MFKLFCIFLLVFSLNAEDFDSFSSDLDSQLEQAQEIVAQEPINISVHDTNALLIEEKNNIREHKLYLIAILSVSAITILWLMLKYLISKEDDNYNLIRLCGIVVILFMTGFVILIAEDSSQLSAIIGLLGAIAGYFLKEGKELLTQELGTKE